MTSQLRPALSLFVLLAILTGGVYPAVVTVIAQVVFPHQANGSLVKKGDTVIGSELIGQSFTGPGYFWGRPSATDSFEYNAGSSSGSNLGPTNKKLLDDVAERVKKMRDQHRDQKGPVPIDLVTASGSGLDPDISPDAAHYQEKRVALARKLSLKQVQQLVQEHIEQRTFGVLGEPRVNVLRLNLALDKLSGSDGQRER